jgi:hypothetical protein
MKTNQRICKQAFIVGCLFASVAFGANKAPRADVGGATSNESYRMARRAGMYLAYGDPYPTIIGVGAAYQVTDFLKAQVGFGKVSAVTGSISAAGITVGEASATTVGFGVKGTVPGWNFTPTVGLHFAHLIYSGTGIEVGGFTQSGSHVYTSFGFDWQLQSGFNLSGGYQHSFKSGIGGGIFLGAGWFVDWLG